MGFSGAMEETWLQRGVAERERETRLAMHTKVCAWRRLIFVQGDLQCFFPSRPNLRWFLPRFASNYRSKTESPIACDLPWLPDCEKKRVLVCEAVGLLL